MARSAFAIASTNSGKLRHEAQSPELGLSHPDMISSHEATLPQFHLGISLEPKAMSRPGRSVTLHSREKDVEPSSFSKGTSPCLSTGDVLHQLLVPAAHSSYRDCEDSVELTLTEDNSFNVIGKYKLWVRKGSISLLGTALHASHRVYRVEVMETQPLPTIQLLKNPFWPNGQIAEISVISLSSAEFSPGNYDSRSRYSSTMSSLRFSQRSFGVEQLQPMINPTEHEERAPVSPRYPCIGSHDPVAFEPRWESEWRSLATKLSLPSSSGPRSILVCGTEGNSKAFFSKFIANNFLSGRYASSGIGFMDLDPMQPEYTPPGCVSSLHIKDLNLGPPFTHPWPIEDTGNKILRCHFVGLTSQQDELSHYLKCSKNLLKHCQIALSGEACPLVTKSCDRVHGTRHSNLVALIGVLQPTDVVVVDGPDSDKLSGEIQDVCSQTGAKIHSLRGNNVDFGPGDTAADLRDVQCHSYFHLPAAEGQLYRWHLASLSRSMSTELFYGGLCHNIAGFIFYGDEINYDMLHNAVRGTVFAVVALEDVPNIGGISPGLDPIRPISTSPEIREHSQTLLRMSLQHKSGGNYCIGDTKQGLPIVSSGSGYNRPLDPKTTHCLGFVVVQTIDTKLKRLTVVTPISQQTFSSYRAASIPLLLAKHQSCPRNFDGTAHVSTSRPVERDPKRWLPSSADKCFIAESRLLGLSKSMLVSSGKADREKPAKALFSKATMHRKNTVWRVRRNLKASKGNK